MTQSYPSYPQGEDRNEHSYFPVEHGPAPTTIRVAVGLMLLRCLFGIASIIVLFATKDSVKRSVAKDNHGYTTQHINNVVNGLVVGITVIAVIFLVFYAVLALLVSKGKQWARIVTWVFGGFGVLSLLASFGEDVSTGNHVVSALTGVDDIAIIILLIVGGKSGFFRRKPADQHYDGAYPSPPYPAPPA
jgi:uncharacterized membrane protein (DUF485 family)